MTGLYNMIKRCFRDFDQLMDASPIFIPFLHASYAYIFPIFNKHVWVLWDIFYFMYHLICRASVFKNHITYDPAMGNWKSSLSQLSSSSLSSTQRYYSTSRKQFHPKERKISHIGMEQSFFPSNDYREILKVKWDTYVLPKLTQVTLI